MSESTIEVKPSNFTFEEKRGRPKADNPFGPHITESWAKRDGDDAKVGMTLEVTLKNDSEFGVSGQPKNIVTALGQIRDAAREQNLGVRTETRPAIKQGKKINFIDADEDGRYNTNNATHTVIYFAAKPRTKRTRTVSEESAED
jgi:hypothetical protein